MAYRLQDNKPIPKKKKKTDASILLLLDGHNSYELDAFHKATFEHNIIVAVFPSKCTHKLQPLDVIIFT
jgi:hypothetical protein